MEDRSQKRQSEREQAQQHRIIDRHDAETAPNVKRPEVIRGIFRVQQNSADQKPGQYKEQIHAAPADAHGKEQVPQGRAGASRKMEEKRVVEDHYLLLLVYKTAIVLQRTERSGRHVSGNSRNSIGLSKVRHEQSGGIPLRAISALPSLWRLLQVASLPGMPQRWDVIHRRCIPF